MPGKTYKIALCEDDQFISNMYVTKLQLSGFEIHHAEDGEAGVAMIKEIKPDLILLDILMPKKSGFEVLEEIKADPTTKDIPVILLTNLSQKEDVDRGLQLGAKDYLIKAHFTPREVVEKINKVLGVA